MRVVLDTNVIIAAFATRGLCQTVFEWCLASHDIITSDYVLHEVERGLRRKLRLPASHVADVLRFLQRHAISVDAAPLPKIRLRDQTDLPILATALTGEADCLVTGDQGLLGLGQIEDIPILSPRTFWEQRQR